MDAVLRDTSVLITRIVSGERRTLPRAWWRKLKGEKPPLAWNGSNGCTASPDTWRGFVLWPGCDIHDWHYARASTIRERIRADYFLWLNLRTLLALQRATRLEMAALPLLYWRVVRTVGWTRWKRG